MKLTNSQESAVLEMFLTQPRDRESLRRDVLLELKLNLSTSRINSLLVRHGVDPARIPRKPYRKLRNKKFSLDAEREVVALLATETEPVKMATIKGLVESYGVTLTRQGIIDMLRRNGFTNAENGRKWIAPLELRQ